MVLPFDLKRVILGVVVGGALGFGYQKLVGCRTGACPLTATPLRAITYGVFVSLLFTLAGCKKTDSANAQVNPNEPSAKEPTMSIASNVIHLTSGAFEKVKSQDKPVIIDFWAPSADRGMHRIPLPIPAKLRSAAEPRCGPCRMQGPILDQVSSQIGDRAIVAKVNVDEEPALAAPFGVQAIPTLVVLKGGKIVHRFTGVQQADTLVKALEAAGA